MYFQFLHPEYFWFLFTLLIPIIIHLFNFKRFKKIYFSNLKFLQGLTTEHKRKSKIKRLLILLLRLLAIACLVIAFAQPYSPDNKDINQIKRSNESINIYIDNSFSMNGNTERGNALEVAKNKAFDLVKSLPDYSKIRVYSNDIKHYSSTLNKSQAIARIQEIEPSPVPVQLSKQIQNILIDKKQEQADIYVLSDFQKSQSDFENLQSDSTCSINFLPLTIQPTNNLVLDTCWFKNPIHDMNASQELFVKISNHSDHSVEKIPVQLSINDSIKSIASADIEAHSSQVVKLRFINHSKICMGKVEINDYPITYDNILYFSFKTSNKTKILVINQFESNRYLTRLFSTPNNYELVNCPKLQYHNYNLAEYQLIILNEVTGIESGFNQSLQKYLRSGGNVLFVPGDKITPGINEFLTDISAPNFSQLDTINQRLSGIELNSEIYKKVFEEIEKDARMPDIYKYYQLTDSSNSSIEVLWKTNGNESLFHKLRYGKGQFFQLAINLRNHWTNLMTHPIFVPSIINLSKYNTDPGNIYYETGKNIALKINDNSNQFSDEQFHIKNENLLTDVIPQKVNQAEFGTLLYTHGQIKRSGNYLITEKDSVLQACSFNYSRKESLNNCYTIHEIKTKTSSQYNIFVISSVKVKLSEIYHEQRSGNQIWRTFILMCCLLFILEGILQNTKML